MAKLTRDQWEEMRAEWEGSPRQGITWLTKAAGGRWDITEEAIRRQRIKQGWSKPVDLRAIARQATINADAAAAKYGHPLAEPPRDPQPEALPNEGEMGSEESAQGVTVGEAPMKSPNRATVAEQTAVDLRTKLIEMHRGEWRIARRLLYASLHEADKATGFDKSKFAKITTEIIANIQNGERRVWGLDADILDLEAMSDAQLKAIAEGKGGHR
jgi:hypothetical protein